MPAPEDVLGSTNILPNFTSADFVLLLVFFSKGTVVIPAARVAEVGVCLINLSIRR